MRVETDLKFWTTAHNEPDTVPCRGKANVSPALPLSAMSSALVLQSKAGKAGETCFTPADIFRATVNDSQPPQQQAMPAPPTLKHPAEALLFFLSVWLGPEL